MAPGKRKKRTRTAWRILLRGMLTGAAALVVSVLILTLLVYLGWIPESAVSIGNTVVKILTALAAGIAVGAGREGRSWILGGIAAILALLLSVVGMSIYLGAFTPTWTLLADLLMSFAIGCAAAAVFLKRKTE